MSLTIFLLITTNVYFFLGLAYYVQSQNTVVFGLSSVGALLVLLAVWWSQSHEDPLLAALLTGVVALGYLSGALVCFGRSSMRPDFFGRGITLILISAAGFGATACVALLEWPLELK